MMSNASRWLQLPVDLVLVTIAWWLAFWLRFNLDTPDEFQIMMVRTVLAPLLAYGLSLLGWGVYRHIWRYTSVAELTRLVYGVAIGGLMTAAIVLLLRVPYFRARCCCCIPCCRCWRSAVCERARDCCMAVARRV